MNCEKIEDLHINTSKHRGVLQIQHYLILKKIKIRPKTVYYVFIKYIYNNNAYRFLVYKSSTKDIHPNTIIKLRNATFFEDMFS